MQAQPLRALIAFAVALAVSLPAHAQDPAATPVSPPPPEPPPAAPVDVAPAPSDAPIEMPSPPAIDEDEYQKLLRELPNDYDINYTYVAPAKGDVRAPDDSTIRLRTDKLRRTTYLQPTPVFVRGGGGLGARLSF